MPSPRLSPYDHFAPLLATAQQHPQSHDQLPSIDQQPMSNYNLFDPRANAQRSGFNPYPPPSQQQRQPFGSASGSAPQPQASSSSRPSSAGNAQQPPPAPQFSYPAPGYATSSFEQQQQQAPFNQLPPRRESYPIKSPPVQSSARALSFGGATGWQQQQAFQGQAQNYGQQWSGIQPFPPQHPPPDQWQPQSWVQQSNQPALDYSSSVEPTSRPGSKGNATMATVPEDEAESNQQQPAPVPTPKGKGKGKAIKDDTVKIEAAEDDADVKMDHRKRKRNRTIQSCLPCHQNKRKCDRKRPCSRCTALSLTGSCVYEVDHARNPDDPEVSETDHLRGRVAELEQVVRELRQRQPPRSNQTSNNTTTASVTTAPGAESENERKRRRVIVDRFARFKMDEAAMAEVAAAAAAQGGLGAQQASIAAAQALEEAHMAQAQASRKSSITSNFDDLSVSPPSQSQVDEAQEPYKPYLLPGEEMVKDSSGRKTFLGPPAGRSMIRRLAELTSSKTAAVADGAFQSVAEDMAYTGVFPDLRKTFPFTTIWSHENFSQEIIGLLPSKEQADLLFSSFKDEVAAFFNAWHLPSLDNEYKHFFSLDANEKAKVPLASLSLYLMICSLGVMMRASLSEMFGHTNRAAASAAAAAGDTSKEPVDMTSSRLQSELYLSAAYQALRLCSFLSSPTIATIQTQVLINIYLLNSERISDAWPLLGSLVRQCQSLGLHLDPTSVDPRMSPREAEVRRRIWWTVAGLEALLCVSFGRPSSITFYTCALPQDRTDDNLSDLNTGQPTLPPSNVMSGETTEQTYHTAYFALAVPTFELLQRVFHVDRRYSRSGFHSWFSPPTESTPLPNYTAQGTTYEDAIRLDRDIVTWYSLLPSGMHFDPDVNTAEQLLATRSPLHINQTLALCVKTHMIRLVLHRPYLRADVDAYPRSTTICWESAHIILAAYKAMSLTKASIIWSWWTMSYRAFHAGTVVAFLAIRQPGTALARKCLDDLRGAILIFQDRIASWKTSHPVQGQLAKGLVQLERLATCAAEEQAKQFARSGILRSPNTNSNNLVNNGNSGTPNRNHAAYLSGPSSSIRAFPTVSGTHGQSNPAYINLNPVDNAGTDTAYGSPFLGNDAALQLDPLNTGDGFGGPESMALHQFWADMFNIKVS